jgi:inosine-uridine nucleoside N-ribohydrolase
MGKKVIIDCDAGVDDALALILAFHSPELEVRAITGVNGNVPMDRVFENIQKVLSLIRPHHGPFIARGAERPLKGEAVYASSFHGEDGLGGANILRAEGNEPWKIFSGQADELIPEMARQNPGEITLIATGPLTNVAMGLRRDPEGMKKLKEVVIMGGAVRTRGNVTPFAEFNFFVDPTAAKIVLESGLPITLVPLDVTHQVFLTSRVMEEKIKPIEPSFSTFVLEATGYQSVNGRFRPEAEIYHLHDPLAVGVTIRPELVRMERLALCVEAHEGEHYGRVFETEEGPKVDVCLGVDAKQFLDLFISRLS